jgi:hypothetical protein
VGDGQAVRERQPARWRGLRLVHLPEHRRLKVQQLAPIAQQPFPKANVGDHLTGTTEGPLDFNRFGGYTLVARALGTVADRGLEPEKTRAQRRDELAVATYNVENLDPSDPQTKFDAPAAAVGGNLASPEIVALEEIQGGDPGRQRHQGR